MVTHDQMASGTKGRFHFRRVSQEVDSFVLLGAREETGKVWGIGRRWRKRYYRFMFPWSSKP